MQKLTWDTIEREAMNQHITRQTLHGEDATLARFFLKQGGVVPRHAHRNEQFTNVLSGALLFRFDDREVTVRAGEVVRIAPHEAHHVEVLEDSEVLDVFAPRREDWLRQEDNYLRGK